MNHTTVARIFAISMVAALMIVGLSILSSTKVMAASLKVHNLRIGTSEGAVSLQGPDSLSINTEGLGNGNGNGNDNGENDNDNGNGNGPPT
jgi:hypothetical protein